MKSRGDWDIPELLSYRDKLTLSDKELIQSTIIVVNEHGRKDTLGRLEQIEFDQRLRDREPKVELFKHIQ